MRDLHILSLCFGQSIAQKMRNFIWFLYSLTSCGILLLFWHAASKGSSTVAGVQLSYLNSYYLLLAPTTALLVTHVELYLAFHLIKNGNLTDLLLKPYSLFKRMFAAEFPWRIIQCFFGIIAIGILMVLGVHINIDFNNFSFLILLMFIGAFLLSLLIKISIGLLAFWIVDISTIMDTLEVSLIFTGGLLIPLELMPQWLQSIAFYTPFPYFIYYPLASLLGKVTYETQLHVLLIQMGWITIFTILYNKLLSNGLRKFSGVSQ